MQGLFKKNTKASLSKGKLLTCADCGLFKFAKSPRMPPTGGGKKRILVCAECPGATEDQQNQQLIGKSGQLLRSVLEDFDINLDIDCWKTNACICRSLDNKTPSDTQIKCCRPNLFKTIKEFKPKKIILLGASALQSAIGEKVKIGSLEKWTGQQIPDQDIKSWLFPTYHPSFILRDSKNKALDLLFKKHLRSAIDHCIDFPDYGKEQDKINVILDENKAVEYLRSILINNIKYLAFDYETTGIKLNAKGHKIICMSIAIDGNSATAFPMFYGEIFQDLLKKILTDFWIKKTIANAKYEWLATKCILGYEVQGIYRDTMLNAHVLDNREEVTGLKFQTYVRFGTSGYDVLVKPYMNSDEDFGDNSFNKLEILFKRDPVSVLTYCGMDSMFTFRLGEDQTDELLKNNLYNASNLLLDGTLALADVENNGIKVDTNYYRNQDLIQDRKIRRISKKIQDSIEVQEWNKIKRIEFNPDSPTQLNKLFYDILKYAPTKLTNKGAPSVDKEVLFDLNTEFANLILVYRKETGLKEKINGILIETVDGILRCHYNLNLVRSYRSSTNSVNWQNFPKRDKESFKIARSGIIPRKGHCIGEVDYCFIKETLIKTLLGSKTIEYIINNYLKEDIYVYSYKKDKKRIGLSKVIGGVKTGVKKEVWKVVLDNDKEIFVTPNHKFMLRNEKYKKVSDLKINDSLMPFYKSRRLTKYNPSGYYWIKTNNFKIGENGWIPEHQLVAIDILDIDLKKNKLLVHHIDGNGLNNNLDNLKVLTRNEHMSIHATQGWNNPSKNRDLSYMKTEKYRKELSKRTKEWWSKIAEEEKEKRIKYLQYDKTGKNNPMWGRKQSEETKRRISETKKSKNNHKIKSIEFYGYEDVYNVKIENDHNYALDAGIIVKNCQIEVRIGSCYHHDPVMIKYITDPTTDMHRDSASEIFLLEQDQVTKKIRYHAKNKFVFPAFYGSFYAQMSPDLYKCALVENLDDGTPLIKHLKKHGINSYEKFELHLKGVENIFWKERFKVYDEWKTKTWEEYQRKGYIDSLTGFRYSGLMKKNDTLNLGIQGSAFHCLLQSLITLNNISKKEKWDSKIIGQIHDSMVWDFNPDELNHIIPIIKRVMCEDIKKKWEWITIPLVVDIEVAEVDSSWYEMKSYSEDEDD